MTTMELGEEAPAPTAAPGARRQPAVEAQGLRKVYPNGHVAIDGVSLVARPGEVVGVVGPNGAGKSTTLRILATLLAPSAGAATICGHPLVERTAIRRLIGVALQEAGLDPLMTGREHFAVQTALYQLERSVAAARTAELIERFGLGPVADRPVGVYSGGTARRLDLALALLHEPPVILFDEPTVGLDPRSRRDVWALIREWADLGRVVIFSTQYLEEADILCDRVYVVDHGEVVVEGTPAALKGRLRGAAKIRLAVSVAADTAAERLRVALAQGVTASITAGDGQVTLAFDSDDEAVAAVPSVVSAASAAGVGLRSIAMSAPTFEDVFLAYTGSTLEPESQTGKGMDMTARTNRGLGGRAKR